MSKKKEAAGKRPGRRLTAALGAVAVVAVGTGVGSAFHPATSFWNRGRFRVPPRHVFGTDPCSNMVFAGHFRPKKGANGARIGALRNPKIHAACMSQ